MGNIIHACVGNTAHSVFREEKKKEREVSRNDKAKACDIKERHIEEQQSTVDLPRLSAAGAER